MYNEWLLKIKNQIQQPNRIKIGKDSAQTIHIRDILNDQ